MSPASRSAAAPALSIIDTMDDPQCFEPWFRGSTWWGWRCILKGAYALPMDEEETAFFRNVADRDPPSEPVKELWCCVGRRGGKDSIASVIAAHTAAFFSDQDRLRPGERATVVCLATDRDQAKIIHSYVRSYFSSVDMLQALLSNGDGTAHSLELDNGVDISILTSSFRAVRGRAVLAAVLDECAFWRDDTSTNPDLEVYNALRPGLASLPGSILIGISSPYARSGLLYKKYRDHYGKNSAGVLVIKAPTRLLNPTIDQKIIDEALAEDPASARAEWMAEFRDDVAGWASRELIEAPVDRGVTVRPPLPNIIYSSFVDASGGVRDSFTAAVAHTEDGVAVLDCLVEIKAPFNPDKATADISEMLKAYRCSSTQGDKYAAGWVIQAFAKCGISYRHSERDRSSIYLDALPLFTTGRARLLDNNRLVQQFAGLERRTSTMGKDKIDHGPGGHDDACNSCAGALVLATTQAPDLEIVAPIIVSSAGVLSGLPTAQSRPPAHYLKQTDEAWRGHVGAEGGFWGPV
jgi:hypothetical protein